MCEVQAGGQGDLEESSSSPYVKLPLWIEAHVLQRDVCTSGVWKFYIVKELQQVLKRSELRPGLNANLTVIEGSNLVRADFITLADCDGVIFLVTSPTANVCT